MEALTNVKGRLTIHALDGTREKVVELPTIGSVGGVSGEPDHDSFYYGFTSFTYPTTIYRYDLTTGMSEVVYEPEVEGFDADQYAVEQVFYESTDGTEVPVFVVHEKGLERDGTNPTYLYGYGGFNITITPNFSPGNWPGSKWAASTPSPTCGAAGRTAPPGTRRASWKTSSRCSTFPFSSKSWTWTCLQCRPRLDRPGDDGRSFASESTVSPDDAPRVPLRGRRRTHAGPTGPISSH